MIDPQDKYEQALKELDPIFNLLYKLNDVEREGN
jgi:hypothetical protein